MSDENKFNRRDLLKGIGLTCAMSLIHDKMTNQIVNSFISSAQAAPGALPNFRYINFFTYGGLPRWYFDLPVAPNGDDKFNPGKQIITSMKMESNGEVSGKYQHIKMGDFFLPLLWSYDIPLVGGGIGKLNELASSGLFIRGIDQGLDGHDFNTLKQNSPVSGGMSYSGLFSDSGNTPVPTANTDGSFEHRSAKSKSNIRFLSRGDLKVLSTSFSDFKTTDPKSFNRRDAAEKMIKLAVSSIQKTQGTNSPYVSAIKENRDNALELLGSDFSKADEEYTVIFNKYKMLISRALSMPLPGVTDSPINAIPGDSRFRIYVPGLDPYIMPSEKTGDIQVGFSSLIINPEFTHSFALAEFLITKNLSSSVLGNLRFFQNFDVLNYYLPNSLSNNSDLLQAESRKLGLGVDAHATGTFPALIMFTRHYHAYATCLHELMSVLKGKNLYDQTLIHTTSDFNRVPQKAGSGSDHGFDGCATSVFSGRIKSTVVVGNIHQGTVDQGAWGKSANCESLGNRKINIGNVASTICSIFDLPTPAINDTSLISLDENKNVIMPKVKPANIA